MAASAGVGCSKTPTSPAAFDDASAGNVKSLPVGTLVALSGAPAIVGRDESGVYAMTVTCTHQGCDVAPTTGSASASPPIRCPCHGATYDANGAVTGGPAPGSLAHFAVEIDAQGNITVHGQTQVSSAVRVAVPSGLG